MIVAGFDRYDLINTPMADGPTFTVWFAGCTHGCKGCQNKVLWDKNNGEDFSPYELFGLIVEETKKTKIRTVTLLGGEPLQQNIDDLVLLCHLLDRSGFKIWIYTGYEFDAVPNNVLRFIDYIKCGKYIEELRTEDGSFPITKNQKVYSKAGGWKPITINKEDIQCT